MEGIKDYLYSIAFMMLEVKLSSVNGAGYGVFATRKIPAHTCLGFYPGFAYEKAFYKQYMKKVMSKMPLAYRKQQMKIREQYGFEHECDKNTIIIDPFPEFLELTYKATCNGNVIALNNEDQIAMTLIFMNERDQQNVAYVSMSHHVAVITCRTICQGEELFSHYGASYAREEFGYSLKVDAIKYQFRRKRVILPRCMMNAKYDPITSVYRSFE